MNVWDMLDRLQQMGVNEADDLQSIIDDKQAELDVLRRIHAALTNDYGDGDVEESAPQTPRRVVLNEQTIEADPLDDEPREPPARTVRRPAKTLSDAEVLERVPPDHVEAVAACLRERGEPLPMFAIVHSVAPLGVAKEDVPLILSLERFSFSTAGYELARKDS